MLRVHVPNWRCIVVIDENLPCSIQMDFLLEIHIELDSNEAHEIRMYTNDLWDVTNV
jgi:hypothetical protein